jgi:hypothetical protein
LDSADGTWREAIGDSGGIYGEAGGFIAFLDGHVEFFPNITDGQTMLTHYYSGEKTSKISETVNRGARAISWKGIEWEAN